MFSFGGNFSANVLAKVSPPESRFKSDRLEELKFKNKKNASLGV